MLLHWKTRTLNILHYEKESNITNPTLKENNKLIKSSSNSENFIKTSKPSIEHRKEQPHATNSISGVKESVIIYIYIYYFFIEGQ